MELWFATHPTAISESRKEVPIVLDTFWADCRQPLPYRITEGLPVIRPWRSVLAQSSVNPCRLGRNNPLSVRQNSYFFFSGGADGGRSELKMSATVFHLPSACFFHTSTVLPWSVTGLPCGSFWAN